VSGDSGILLSTAGKVIEFPPTEITGITSELKNDFTKLRIADGKGDITATTLRARGASLDSGTKKDA
jgi:hypothetical protein